MQALLEVIHSGGGGSLQPLRGERGAARRLRGPLARLPALPARGRARPRAPAAAPSPTRRAFVPFAVFRYRELVITDISKQMSQTDNK